MQLPTVNYIENINKQQIDSINFAGLNRQPKRLNNEFSSMTNISSQYVGCLYPRPSRSVIATLTNGQALFACTNGKLCWVDGTNFVYDGVVKGTVTATAKSIVDFYGKILIFPDKKYYNIAEDTFSNMGNGGTYPDDDGSVPDMDMICVFENRVWGIKGFCAYASKYNDPLDWTFSADPEQKDDSIFIELTPDKGQFVGLIPLENHMIFATKTSTYEGYGTARNYLPHLVSNSRGAISGKSLAEVDGMVFMLAADGVNVYTGSIPRPISLKLNENYVSGVAGTDGRRYYLSLYNGSEYNLYYCDTAYLSLNQSNPSAWYREDNLQVKDFASVDGKLYALTGDNKVIQFNSGSEVVEWEAITGEINNDYLGNTISLKIKMEAQIEAGATLNYYLKEQDGEFELIDTYTYTSGAVKTYQTSIIPKRSERFQIKISGIGKVKVMALARETIIGSDVMK